MGRAGSCRPSSTLILHHPTHSHHNPPKINSQLLNPSPPHPSTMPPPPDKRVRKPKPKQDNIIDKLSGASNFPASTSSIQTLLESKDLWAVTTGERTKPTKPSPPARNACWVRERAYRDACADYKRSLKAWEKKSPDAWVKVWDSCEDGVQERIGKHRYGEIAWRILEEFCGPQDGGQTGDIAPMVFYDLVTAMRGKGQSVAEFAEHIENLA